MTLTIEYDRHGLAGIWSDTDEDIWPQIDYAVGYEPAHYPVPATLDAYMTTEYIAKNGYWIWLL